MTRTCPPTFDPAAVATANPLTAADPCAACGAGRWQPVYRGLVDHLTGERFDVDRCDRCGLLATRPPPPADDIGRYYPPAYRGDRHAFTGRWRDRRRAAAVGRWFPCGFRGRALDVGCGTGTFARHLASLGWSVAATEIDDRTVAELRAAGVDAKSPAAAERDGFAGGPFDAITGWHVLEHVADPAAVARWAATQLRPGGVFQATVPNAAGWQAKFFGRHWWHLDVPRHRHHFTPATLRAVLAAAGFTVVGRANVAVEYDLFGIVQSGLDRVCRRRNVLFDRLTGAPGAAPASARDVAISYAVGVPLGAVGVAAMAAGAVAGDGATLTLTCRR